MASTLLFLVPAAFVTGVLNAVAGGGTFISFPALLLAGIPPVPANMTSGISTIPGQFSSVWAYRNDIRGVKQFNLKALLIVSTAGGLMGGLLLLSTPSPVFAGALPWLMLLATTAFALGSFAPPTLLDHARLGPRGVLICQFVIAIYGGYFGAGIGFMMLAVLTFFGMRDIHAMNGLKLMLALCMTLVSSAAFIIARQIYWPEAIAMGLASLAGGYFGARGAKRVEPRLIKAFIVILGAALTLYFFVHGT